MPYLWLKFIHVVSSTILFGFGLGTACIFAYGYRTRDTHVIAVISRYVVLVDWIFTTPSGIVQFITGIWMVMIAGYSWTNFWIWASIAGYCLAGACWLPVVYLQIKMRDFAIQADINKQNLPKAYYDYFRYWFILGWPGFISLIIVFYLMINKPVL